MPAAEYKLTVQQYDSLLYALKRFTYEKRSGDPTLSDDQFYAYVATLLDPSITPNVVTTVGPGLVLDDGELTIDPATFPAVGTSGIPAPALVATSNITLSGNQVVDGVATNTLAAGSYVLATEQTTSANKGPWVVNNAGAWTQPTWYDSNADVAAALGITTGAVIGGNLAGSVWFQSSGTTLAGAKTWAKLTTPSLVQDGLGATLPSQLATQYKGPYVDNDPTNGRNRADHAYADIRTYGGNPSGAEATTCLSRGGPVVDLGAAGTKVNGNWTIMHQHGAAHGMTTPGAPVVVAQGVTGATTISVKVVAVTSTHGYTAASAATTIANANAALGILDAGTRQYTTFVEIWGNATPTPGAYKYALYVQFGGVGSYNYAGMCIAWPQYDAEGNVYPMSFRLVTNAAKTAPGGLPPTAPSAAVPNALRTQIISGGRTAAVTVFPVPINIPAAPTLCTLCNKIPFEAASTSSLYGTQVKLATGQYYLAGDTELRTPSRITGVNSGHQQADSLFLLHASSGWGAFANNTGNQWQPGTLYRVGDRVVASRRSGAVGTWVCTAIAASKVWGLSGTGGDPTWNYTPLGTTTDNEITWTFQSTLGLSSASGWAAYHIAWISEDGSAPAHRSFAPNDLRFDCTRAYTNGTPVAVWAPGQSAPSGSYLIPSVANATGKLYKSSGGTTGATEPVWGRRIGGTTSDNGITWTCIDMYQRQGAAVMTLVPGNAYHCQIKNTGSAGLFLEGNTYSTGGNTDVSYFVRCDFQDNFGSDIVTQGADGNGGRFVMCTFQPARAGDGACFIQDNSFYGCQFIACIGNGNNRIQNQVWTNAQSSFKADCCYSEANAPGDADINYPGVWEGGNMRRRPGSKPRIINGGDSVAAPYDSPLIETDLDSRFFASAVWAAGTPFASGTLVSPTVDNGMIYVSSGGTTGATEPVWPTTQGYTIVDTGVTWTCSGQPVSSRRMLSGFERRYYGLGTLAQGTALQELHGGFTADGRTYVKTGANEITVEQTDHYRMLGAGKIFPKGIAVGVGTTFSSVSSVPTLGAFLPGSVLFWSGNGANAPRLAIMAEDYGSIGASAWVGAHAYAQGEIVTSSGWAFVCVVPGTSAASIPATFATASAFSFHQDGTGGLKWQAWFPADPHLRGIPNLSQEPVAISDADQTLQITQGCVRKCAAWTANRAITLGVTGMMPGDTYRIEQHNSVAFTATYTSIDGGSMVMPALTKCWSEVEMLRSGALSQVRSGVYL